MDNHANDSGSDRIYAAGFFDGEGCVNISKMFGRTKEPGYKLQLMLTNTHMPTLEWFQERWGGRMYKHTRGRSVLTDNPQGCWFLAWSGAEAAELLREWEPFMRVKQEQARNALAFQALKAEARGHKTPADLRARMDRHWQIGRRLNAKDDSAEIPIEVLLAEADQLELL